MIAGGAARSSLPLIIVALVSLCGCAGLAPLETIIRGGEGPPTLVILHGYGSSAEEWLPFTASIALGPGGRFVFPQGPGAGPGIGRGWWPMDLSRYREADGLPDLSRDSPEGLETVASRVAGLLREIRSAVGRPLIAGGFSQGGMVMSEIAFRSDTPIDALVLLSSTIVSEAAWATGYASRRGLPVFIAHGRHDRVLSFAIAERYQRSLRDAGLAVTWHPFDGEHEIPAEVVVALNTFLAGVLSQR